MKYILSRDGRMALKRLTGATLFALDYDGTLAPIVSQPTRAAIAPRTVRELRRLCAFAQVAVISGRKLDDLSSRVPETVRYLLGNHGNEGLAKAPVDRATCVDICRRWLDQLHRAFDQRKRFHGMLLEDKGVTLSVHTRHMKDYVSISDALTDTLAALDPEPRIVDGPCLFNLIPPGAICKDDALDLLVRHAGARNVLYVGDDECDELVFERAPPHWITVRVGESARSAARYFLPAQQEMGDLLLFLNLQLGLSRALRC
ncbi:MAG: trehalose-phosphatase [Rhodocyclaceae bacterium]|nr:MAG: trehalose-phosphatase [Rhodocyclaceae bacterium]